MSDSFQQCVSMPWIYLPCYVYNKYTIYEWTFLSIEWWPSEASLLNNNCTMEYRFRPLCNMKGRRNWSSWFKLGAETGSECTYIYSMFLWISQVMFRYPEIKATKVEIYGADSFTPVAFIGIILSYITQLGECKETHCTTRKKIQSMCVCASFLTRTQDNQAKDSHQCFIICDCPERESSIIQNGVWYQYQIII